MSFCCFETLLVTFLNKKEVWFWLYLQYLQYAIAHLHCSVHQKKWFRIIWQGNVNLEKVSDSFRIQRGRIIKSFDRAGMSCDFLSWRNMFVFQSRAAGQDVWQYSAAAGSGGAAEKGGEHQEDLRQSGRRGHQGESGAHLLVSSEEVYPFTG